MLLVLQNYRNERVDVNEVTSKIDPEWENVFRSQQEKDSSFRQDLGRVGGFGLLTEDELVMLERAVHLRYYRANECIIQKEVPQSGLYIISEGSVNVVCDGVVVELLKPISVLGEFGLLDPSPHSLSFFAAEPTKLIGFFKPDLMELLDTQPEMGCKILLRFSQNMARILREQYADLCDLSCEPGE